MCTNVFYPMGINIVIKFFLPKWDLIDLQTNKHLQKKLFLHVHVMSWYVFSQH